MSLSSRAAREAYLAAQTGVAKPRTEAELSELEVLADPLKRAVYDQQLGVTEDELSAFIEHDDNPWRGIIKYGFALLAFLVFMSQDNIVRGFGFFFAPDFRERRVVKYGDFTREDGLGRVLEYSDHAFVSVFESSNNVWSFLFKHEIILVLPVVALAVLISVKWSKVFSRFASNRISKVRCRGEDDTRERKLWTVGAWLCIVTCFLLLCAFGYDRVISVGHH